MKKLITAALIPATSFAGFEDGNGLLARCTTTEANDLYFQNSSNCLAYIAAISDAQDTLVGWGNMEPKFCLPEGVTRGQLKKIVVKDLNENPADLHLNAGSLVINALYSAFPPSYKDDLTSYCPD